jgi:hypothetical protein
MGILGHRDWLSVAHCGSAEPGKQQGGHESLQQAALALYVWTKLKFIASSNCKMPKLPQNSMQL